LEVSFDGSRAAWAGSTDRPALVLAILDSGGGDAPETFTQSQVDWLETSLSGLAAARRTKETGAIPVLAYFHIPTAEYVLARNASTRAGAPSKCFGFVDDDIAPVEPGAASIVDVLAQSQAKWNMTVVSASVGHNHGRDDCC